MNPHHHQQLQPDDDYQRNQRSWLSILISWLRWKQGGKRSLQLAGATFAAAVVAAATYRQQGGAGKNNRANKLLTSLVDIVVAQLKRRRSSGYRSATEAPLSMLWAEAKLGGVQRALISADSVAYQIRGSWKKSLLPSASMHTSLLETLSKHGCTDVAAMPESLLSKLATPALAALPFVYLYFVYRMMRGMSGADDQAKTADGSDTTTNTTTFADVAGIDKAVREVSEIVTYLRRPEVYANVGAHAPRGILLYGPPGSGKTLLARAVAGEAACGCFLACSGSDFVDTFVGRGASRVRKLFAQAKQQAAQNARSRYSSFPARVTKRPWFSSTSSQQSIHKPSAIIFIDEIDALAKSRSSSAYLSSNDERDQTLNQLLTCLDGFSQNDNVTIILICATNRPDVLDPAFLRRMDRQVEVGLPNQLGRLAILQVHARLVYAKASNKTAPNPPVDWNYLAMQTDGFSGAELRTVTNEAALLAVRQRGDVVQQHHWIQAVQKVKEMKYRGGPSSVAMMGSPHAGMILR